jgi:WD40-like Beta Propeller Repeat
MSKPSGFSATIPYDQSAVFDPKTGNVWWFRNFNTVMEYNARNHKFTANSVCKPYYQCLLGKAPFFQAGDITPRWNLESWASPNGKYVAFQDCPLSNCPPADGQAVYIAPRAPHEFLQVITTGRSTGIVWSILTWLNNKQLLIQWPYDDVSNFEIITVEPNIQGHVQYRVVLPNNSRNNSRITPSPDGQQIAFFSADANNVSNLFITQATGQHEPRMLAWPKVDINLASSWNLWRWQ